MKFNSKLLLAFLFLFVFVTAQAQAGIDFIGLVGNLVDLGTTFGTVAGLAAAVIWITEILKIQLMPNRTWTIALSYGVGAILGGIGWALKIGIFENIKWYNLVFVLLIAIPQANGFYGYNWVRKILNFLTPQTHQVELKEA